MNNPDEIAIVILAAGQSLRMGRPKQLLPWHGRPLIRHIAETALAVPQTSVMVVLGAHQQPVADALQTLPLELLFNEHWSEGMASSIRAAVQALQARPEVSAALFMLCDQPWITAELIHEIIATHRSGASIVATGYDETLGAPAVLASVYFSELLTLSGDQGAKKIIQRHPGKTVVVPFTAAAADLDTPEDYMAALDAE